MAAHHKCIELLMDVGVHSVRYSAKGHGMRPGSTVAHVGPYLACKKWNHHLPLTAPQMKFMFSVQIQVFLQICSYLVT